MPTIAVVSQKGGSGKTTLALNLAACAAHRGRQSCVIDTDPQATAAAWGDWRGDFLPQIVTCPPIRLARMIQSLERDGSDFIVIDTPPHGESAVREAVREADLVLMPTRPRAFDLHALEATADAVVSARKPAFVLLNGVPARGIRIVEEAGRHVAKLGLELCPVHFGERAMFHRSSATGEVALEAEPSGKAAGEVEALWKWLCKELGMHAGKARAGGASR